MFKRLFTETLIYGIGAILPRLINFLLTKVFTDEGAIPTEEFSVFVQIYGLASVVNVLLSFGLETTFFRFASKAKTHKIILSTAFWWIATHALVFLFVMFAFNGWIAGWAGYTQHPEYLKLFAIIVFFDALSVLPLALLRFTNKPIKFSVIRILPVIIQTVLVLVFFHGMSTETLQSWGMEQKVSYPFVANVIASVLMFLFLVKEWSQIKFQIDKALLKPMFRYAYPIMFAGLAFAINENLDKIIMKNALSDAEAGAYGACYKLAVFMTLFVTAFRMGIEPFFFKQSQEGNAKKIYALILQYFVIFCGFAAIVIIANIGWLSKFMIPNTNYHIALGIVPIIVIANLFFGVYTNLSVWYKVTDKTRFGMYFSWVGAGITIALNFILMPIFGFMVAAYATLFAYGTMMLLSYFMGRRNYKVPYKRNKILLYLFISIGMVLVSYYVFDSNFWLGNLLVLLYLAITFLIEKASLKKIVHARS